MKGAAIFLALLDLHGFVHLQRAAAGNEWMCLQQRHSRVNIWRIENGVAADGDISRRIRPRHPSREPQRGTRRVLGRVADRWAALIICALHERSPMRNGELMRVVDGITQKMLTQTLRNLETDGLVGRTAYNTVPPRVEYRLTTLGQGVYKPLAELCQWTESNLDELKRVWGQAAAASASPQRSRRL